MFRGNLAQLRNVVCLGLDGGLDLGEQGRVVRPWGRVHPREKTLGVGHIAFQLLDDPVQVISRLGVLIDLRLEVFEDLGVNHA